MWLICASNGLSLWIILILGYNVYHQWCLEVLMQFSYSNFLRILKIKVVGHCYGRGCAGNTGDIEEMRNSLNFSESVQQICRWSIPSLGEGRILGCISLKMVWRFRMESRVRSTRRHKQTSCQFKSASDTVHKREICQYTDTRIPKNWRRVWIC